jgi:hypothetical protein
MSSLLSPANLQKAVRDSLEESIATIPPGKKGALLVDATSDRVQIHLAEKVGDAWVIAGTVAYDGRHVAGKVAVAGSW